MGGQRAHKTFVLRSVILLTAKKAASFDSRLFSVGAQKGDDFPMKHENLLLLHVSQSFIKKLLEAKASRERVNALQRSTLAKNIESKHCSWTPFPVNPSGSFTKVDGIEKRNGTAVFLRGWSVQIFNKTKKEEKMRTEQIDIIKLK